MFEDKGIITEDEQTLISRYPDDMQDKLRDKLLRAKDMPKSFSYDSWINTFEQGLAISFSKQENAEVTTIGTLNVSRFIRVIEEMKDGTKRAPDKWELEHDGRLEDFKKYPKGTRIKANGDKVESW